MALAITVLRLVISVAAVILTTVTVGNCQDNAQFGECQPEKASCRECYLELVRAVLGRDDNVFNLSQTFTPPTFDQPSSVIVNYRFLNDCSNSSDIDNCVDEIHIWFWAKSGAYLLHPLATFQFISLLFGNPQPLYEREVYITLDATECYGVGPDHMTLLTQRLKKYIQEQSFYPKMEDDYMPVAANSSTVVGILNNSPYTGVSLSSEHILFLCPLFVTIIIIVLMVIVLLLYVCGGICRFKSNVKAGLKNHTRATILAVTVASFNRILIFIGLDIAALAFRYPCSDPKVKAICEFSSLTHNTPAALLVYDLAALVFFIAFITIAILIDPKFFSGFQKCGGRVRGYNNSDPDSKSNRHSIRPFQYYCCAFAVMGFVFSCLMHSPYITMAYLSDAHYATSILVYYTTILFLEFGVFQYTFRIHFDSGSFIHKNKLLTGILVSVQTVLIYCLVLSASFFYYFIPINNTVSNLPNEGIIVYQTALILLGAFITYKALFKSKKSEQDEHTITHQRLSQQVKESEIAHLKCEIKCLAVNGKDNQEKIAFMRNKIIHLQKEIKLMNIKNKIMFLTEGPDDPTHPIEIARLKQQQCEILAYLKSEIKRLTKEILSDQLNQLNQQNQPVQPDQPTVAEPVQPNQANEGEQQQDQVNGRGQLDQQRQQNQPLHEDIINYKKVEIYRLQGEILDHLLTTKVQLEEGGLNQDDIDHDTIENEIATLKEAIRDHLNNEKDRLDQQPESTEIKEQISSIKKAIEHLDKGCIHSSRCLVAQDQPRMGRRGNNNSSIELTPLNPGADMNDENVN